MDYQMEANHTTDARSGTAPRLRPLPDRRGSAIEEIGYARSDIENSTDLSLLQAQPNVSMNQRQSIAPAFEEQALEESKEAVRAGSKRPQRRQELHLSSRKELEESLSAQLWKAEKGITKILPGRQKATQKKRQR